MTFSIWHRREQTLSIREIDSRPRELFYWCAILVTFALGTAAGDWVSEGMGIGYRMSALLFGSFIAVTALARFGFHAGTVPCFWIAYVLTRPLGASCGDLLAKSTRHGGLGFGTVNTSALFLLIIVGLVIYLSASQKLSPQES